MSHVINSLDLLRIAAGRVPGMRFVELIGRNPGIDTGTVPESIWVAGGLFAFRSAAAVLELVSTSANDAAAGTGARSVQVDGLDANWNEISETIVLNGTTPVTGTKLFLRTNQAAIVTTGTGKTNAGGITIRDAGAGATQRFIDVGRGTAELLAYTIPKDHTLLLTGWYATCRDASGVTNADIDVQVNHNADNGGTHVEWSFSIDGIFTSPFSLPHPSQEKSDIHPVVTRVAANNSVVAWHGHGILIGPNADL